MGDKSNDRRARLAQQLRANLKRRKDQARGRATTSDDPVTCDKTDADQPRDNTGPQSDS